jgi:hypothetical protein
LAIGLLKVYDETISGTIRDVLIIRYIPLFGMDCMELAENCGCMMFLSDPIINNILEDIWAGRKIEKVAYDELVGLCIRTYNGLMK